MTARTAAVPRAHFGPVGWALIILRMVLIVLLLILCVPFHLLWRMLGLARFWPRVFLGSVGAVAELHIKRFGNAEKGALLISNHVTWLDILALAQTSGSAFIAHDGLARFRVLKWLCEMNDTVFVSRERRADVAEQAERIRAATRHGGTLTLFPEGTTSDGTGLLSFKSALLSAFEPLPADAIVQPVLLEYHDAPRVSWIGEEPGLENFKRILARLRPIRLDIRFLEPLRGNALATRKTMSCAAREAMAAAFVLHPRDDLR